MNVYEILEEILEALADGRRENETTSQFRDRKADELQKHFAEKKKEADKEARIADKQAKKAKGEFKANPNSETGQKMIDATFKAADATFKGSDANRKEWKVKEIKNKIDWRKQMSSEALEILEEIKNVVSEDVHSAIDKYAHEIKQPRLHRDAIGNYVDELVDNAKRNLPDNKKNSMDATNDEMNKIEGKRNSTKNKRGERKTDARIAWKDGMNTYWKVKDQRKEDAKNGYKNAVEKSIKRHNKKVNEALDLMEEILFELDTEEKQNISPNKIKKVKKDDNGEKVEVVSVADELFPYEGDAKQQFNQKILAKINDMIEGNGSLEDLIQFVRKGVPAKKKVNEAFDEVMDLLENIYTQIQKVHGEDEYNPMNKSAKLMKRANDIYNKEVDDASRREGKNVREKRLTSKAHKDEWARYHGGQWSKKADEYEGVHDEGATKKSIKRHSKKSAHESIDEGKEPNKECEYRKAKWEEASKKFDDTQAKHTDYAVEHPETKKAYDEERKAYADLEKARKDAKKISYPYHEAVEELRDLVEGLFKKDERGDLLDDIDTTLGSPVKKKIKDIEARMTGCKEKKVDESLEDQINKKVKKDEIGYDKAAKLDKKLQDKMSDEKLDQEYKERLAKLAKRERLDDKAIAKSIRRNEKKNALTFEALDLMEEIINEVSAGYVKKKAEAVIDKRKAEADHAHNFARKVHNYEVNKTGDNKNTPMTDKADNQSYEKGGRWSHAYLLSKHLPDSKRSIKPMVQAAKKVADTRSNHHWNDVEPTGTQEEIKKTYNRAEKAGTLARTDKKFKSDDAAGY